MKKFISIFSLMFLFFVSAINCNASRFIGNEIFLKKIEQIIKSESDIHVIFAATIFMLNYNKFDEVTIATPILDKNKKNFIGEITAKIKVENATSLDEVLNYFNSKTDDHLKIHICNHYKIIFDSSKSNPVRYVSQSRIVEFLGNAIDHEEGGKVFYSSLNETFDDAQVVYETIARKKDICFSKIL